MGPTWVDWKSGILCSVCVCGKGIGEWCRVQEIAIYHLTVHLGVQLLLEVLWCACVCVFSAQVQMTRGIQNTTILLLVLYNALKLVGLVKTTTKYPQKNKNLSFRWIKLSILFYKLQSGRINIISNCTNQNTLLRTTKGKCYHLTMNKALNHKQMFPALTLQEKTIN